MDIEAKVLLQRSKKELHKKTTSIVVPVSLQLMAN